MSEDKEETIPLDWFLPAIECDGNVRESFEAVLKNLDLRAKFIRQVALRLTLKGDPLDSLSLMARSVKELENTLRFRLGLLQADRPAAWFRQAPKTDFGPFRSSVLLAPVMRTYDTEDVEKVREQLQQCWRRSEKDSLPFKDDEESLWSILLNQKSRLERMAQLTEPFEAMRLDEPPDKLPKTLESRSLRAFLVNVCGEFAEVKERLQVCYDHLWNASEKLWHYQIKLRQSSQKIKDHNRSETGDQRRQSGSQRSGPNQRPQDHPRELGISFRQMEALRFMGFSTNPGDELLKKRFLEMAKKLHPDRNGGQDEPFKMLNKAYNSLKRL